MLYGSGTHTYELAEGWAKLPEGWSFIDAPSISIDSQDRVYVLNRSDHPIMVFDHEGNLLTTWGEGFFKRAHGSCIGPDNSIYCTDDRNHTVSKFTLEGKLVMTLGNKDKPSDTGYVQKATILESVATIVRGGPPFNRPAGVALSSSGEIYVSDGYGNARVHKFTPDGKLLFSWGEPGDAPGQFRIPHCICVDKQDRIWVTDRENSRIQIFDHQGKFLDQRTDVIRPNNFCIDKSGVVYVAEIPQRISIFSSNGELLTRWSCAGLKREFDESAIFLAPHAIAVDSRGNIYVGDVPMAISKSKIDRGAKTVLKFCRKT